MNNNRNESNYQLPLYLSIPFSCGYLPGLEAQNYFLAPSFPLNDQLLGKLLAHGFRRNGNHLYRPHCPHCQACVAVRIPCAEFRPNRAQRRNRRLNHDLRHVEKPAKFDEEHYDLYCRYLSARHPDGEMATSSREQYEEFLICPEISSSFHELRLDNELVAVIVTDKIPNALSAVYTFFAPEYAKRGLGTFAIQWQIQHALSLGLEHLYLGYWIAQCNKMSYKTNFRPIEYFINNLWQPMK